MARAGWRIRGWIDPSEHEHGIEEDFSCSGQYLSDVVEAVRDAMREGCEVVLVERREE